MAHWLAPPASAKTLGTVKRFDPRYWTVNFPRPMMASVTTIAPDALRVEALFYNKDDLAGLIWEAEDRWDHALLSYETARDFRRCQLAFRWRSGGLKPLDAAFGPTLTIEGRDAEGAARTWYVRLWNYAAGTAEDAQIALDFGAIGGGWGADDPVWAGDVERMFISLVAPDYDGADEPLAAPASGWAEISEIACAGSGSVLAIGDVLVPEHGLRIATGYDDLYHLTPARMLRGILQLGYRAQINHYVGMSHYFELEDGRAAGALNGPCARWHADFLARAKAMGFEVILSLSYELLDQHCPEAWKQRAGDGDPALTAWEPPSALLSPASDAAMAWLQGVARAFAALAVAAEQPVRFQIGEPWWWVMPDGRICLYDDAAVAAFDPVAIADVRGALDAGQLASLDDAGAVLAASTEALCDVVRDEAPEAECLLLLYMPTLFAAPQILRANTPPGWAAPAFDRLQLEDYEWVTAGRTAASDLGVAEMTARLGYPLVGQHYFAGFVLEPEDAGLWNLIETAAEAAVRRGTGETFVWALPQVLRDGFVHFDEGDDAVDAFEDVLFPIGLGREVGAAVPGEVSIAYHDSERDYQIGLQRAVRPGSRSADRRALPAVLAAGGAKSLAEFRLAALWAGRARATIRASWRASHLRPGRLVEIEGLAGRWTVARWTLGAMTVTLELARASSGTLAELAASPGRATGEPDVAHGPTLLRLLDLPLGDGLGTKPLLFVAAAGPEEGWRRAALSTSYDHGESWEAAGVTAPPAVIGFALDALPDAGSALFDRASTLEVELANPGMWLESRSDDALIAGANLAALGDELIQFGDAEPLGGGRFRLSRLLRGRRGTEWAVVGHEAGDPFTLIDSASLIVLEAPAGAIGGEARIMASGVGDDEDVSQALEIEGRALQPPSPVHLSARETDAGDLEIGWVRRSRQGWAWLSGSEAPLGEESERYRLAIAGAGFERIVELPAPSYLYPAAARASDGAGPLLISVRQSGTFALSRAASIAFE